MEDHNSPIPEGQPAAITAPESTTAEQTTTPEPPETPTEETTDKTVRPDTEALIAEAEQRGYLRGRNEALAESRNEPGLWQMASVPDDFDSNSDSSRHSVTILREIRPSVWD